MASIAWLSSFMSSRAEDERGLLLERRTSLFHEARLRGNTQRERTRSIANSFAPRSEPPGSGPANAVRLVQILRSATRSVVAAVRTRNSHGEARRALIGAWLIVSSLSGCSPTDETAQLCPALRRRLLQ